VSAVISVVTIRPTHFRGQPVQPGTQLNLCEVDAHALVTNGKARLIDCGDQGRMSHAVQMADYRAVSSAVDFIPAVQRHE
jgi:hypothetical protein